MKCANGMKCITEKEEIETAFKTKLPNKKCIEAYFETLTASSAVAGMTAPMPHDDLIE